MKVKEHQHHEHNEHEPLLQKHSVFSSFKYTSYRYRFVILAFYSLNFFLSALMAVCFSSITTNLENMYSLDIFVINFGTSLIFYAVYPPMSFVANYILDEKGLKASVVCGGTMLLAGLWVRTLNKISFFYIFAGQVLGAIGQPLLMNVPQKLSAVWFPSEERPFSTTIASLANPLGAGFGLVIAHIFVSDDADGDTGKEQVNRLMWAIAIIGSVIVIPSYFLFKSQPPTPPSKGADTKKYSYKKSLESLLKNKNYIIFIISTGFAWASVNVLSSILQPLFAPFNFSGNQSGILGAITLVMGLVGSMVWGLYVSRTRKYKKSLMICAFISLISLGGVALLLRTENFYLMIIITVVYGFFTTPILPLSFEFVGEISFPVAEGAAGGFLVFMIQILSVGGTLGVDAFLDTDDKEHAYFSILVMAIMVTIALIGYSLVKEDLRRARLEVEEELEFRASLKAKSRPGSIYPVV